MTPHTEAPQGPDSQERYRQDQAGLAYLYGGVRQAVFMRWLRPGLDYVINVGCGGSPDQLAINQAFAEPKAGKPLAVVGIDIGLFGLRGEARAKIEAGDDVELIEGDAAKVLPKVIVRRGRPAVITARNVDALYLASSYSAKFLKEHPDLDTSWREVIKTVYQALPEEEPGYFVVTYKNNQEYVPLVAYLREAGFLIMAVQIKRPDQRPVWQKVKAALSFESHIGKVEDDQFIMVGIKNIPDDLVALIQKQDPSFSREAFSQGQEIAGRQREAIRRQVRYDKARKFLDQLASPNRVGLVLQMLMRLEISLSEEQIDQLQALTQSPNKVIINLQDSARPLDPAALTDSKPIPESRRTRAELGLKTRFVAQEQPDQEQISVARRTLYRPVVKGERPTGHDILPEGQVETGDIILLRCGPGQLEILEKLIDLSTKDQEK